MKKILFCVPWYSEWDLVKDSLSNLHEYKTGERELTIGDTIITISDIQNCNIGLWRNYFITGTETIDLDNYEIRDFNRVIFCDSDIGFFKKHFLRILTLGQDYSIVSLPYEANDPYPHYNARINGKKVPLTEKGLKPVEACGAGGLFSIAREVFENTEPYWFFPEQRITGRILHPMPEDYSFCDKVRKAGYEIMMDFDYPLYHNHNHKKRRIMESQNQPQQIALYDHVQKELKKAYAIIGSLSQAIDKYEAGIQKMGGQLEQANAQLAKHIAETKPEDEKEQKSE